MTTATRVPSSIVHTRGPPVLFLFSLKCASYLHCPYEHTEEELFFSLGGLGDKLELTQRLGRLVLE